MSVYPDESLYPDLLLFPDGPAPFVDGGSLNVRIRIAFGASIAADPATWTWTDVTQWWHTPDDVSISWGRSSGAEQAETSTLSLTLKNTDGRFTAYDPRSPYWPHVRKWTPIQYDVDLGDGAGWRNRISGFIRRWPLTWPGGSPFMALAKIEAVGVLGRLGRGKPPARSAMRRTIAASRPVAYYPAEDGIVATAAGSAVSGQTPLVVSGAVEFKPVEDFTFQTTTTRYGTSALADLAAGGSLAANFGSGVAAATQAVWTVHAVGAYDVAFSSGDIVLMEWTTPGGTYTRWQLVLIKSTLHTQVIAYTAAGVATVVVDRVGVLGGFRTWIVSAEQVGADINVRYWLPNGTSLLGVVAGTLRGVASMKINPTGTTSTIAMPFGHLAIWDTDQVPYDTNGGLDSYGDALVDPAATSYRQEAAHVRLARLAAEDGVPLTAPAVPVEGVTRMGWQQPGTPLELYQQCETTDQGLIYESGFGLGYLPRDARYNAPVALTIDAALGQLGMPFEPVDDDQMLRNVWTVEREEGASAVAADPESVDLQGEIEGSVRVNLSSDDPLPDHAAWRLHQSTVQEPRYPAVSINLAAHPELAAAWCGCKPGSRIQVVNPPEQNPAGVVDQLVVGASETYRGRRSWKATLNVQPASPWQVATADGPQRAGADGSALQLAITATETVYALTNESDVWTTDPEDFPTDLGVGGEQVRADAPGRVINVNPWLITDAAGWAGSGATISHVTDVVRPDAPWGSLRLVVTGAGGAYNDPVPVAPNTQYRVTTWVRGAVTGGPAVDWQDGGGVYISTSIPAPVAVPAGLWLPVSGVVTSPAGAAFARMRARHDTATPAGTVWHATGITLAQESTVVGAGAFRRMSSAADGRGLNGVQREWPAGTEVDVWAPAIAPL